MEAKDQSIMAWVEEDGNNEYILTIAGKEKIVANANSGYLFYNVTALEEIEKLELLDTSNVTNMVNMFTNCKKLSNLKIGNIIPSNMDTTFSNCTELRTVDFSNIWSFYGTFENCSNLKATLNIIDGTPGTFGAMFWRTSTISSAQVVINYSTKTSDLVNRMITTKSDNSNVVKGIQLD